MHMDWDSTSLRKDSDKIEEDFVFPSRSTIFKDEL